MDSSFSALLQIVRTRRSVRQWQDEAVPREDLERMVEAARWAPSDTNAQPWHFTVVRDRGLIKRLEELSRQRFSQLQEELSAAGRREAARSLKVFARYAAHFGPAPALVLISGEPYDSRFMRKVFSELLSPAELQRMAQEESLKSTALAAMNLLLAAHALGYGAVPMSGPVLLMPEVIQELLRVPPPFAPHLLVAIGRPAGPLPAAPPRKELAAVTTWIG